MDLPGIIAARIAAIEVPIEVDERAADRAFEGGLVQFAFCPVCMEHVPANVYFAADSMLVFCPQCSMRLEGAYWVDRHGWERLGWSLFHPGSLVYASGRTRH